MEMCYDGVLVLPSSYAMMDEEEMTYVEGGGTLRVKASSGTVRAICSAGVALIAAAIGEAFGGPILAKLISGALASIVFNVIIDVCRVKFKAINFVVKKSWAPNVTFNLSNYI